MFEKIKNYSNLVVLPHSVFALPFALASLLVATHGKPSPHVSFLGGRLYVPGSDRGHGLQTG